MPTRYDQAELLTALWSLGSGEDRLPTSHGILDRALKDCLAEIPQVLRNGLSFSDTNVGLRCFQLPDILLAAQEALLTSEPNPTYLSTLVTLDEDGARQIVVSHGISTIQARKIGEHLKESVNKIRSELAIDPDQPVAA
jgi:hypothetical protein